MNWDEHPPKYLYKYRPVDSYLESWIVKGEAYFPPAKAFNDPFDCKANLCFEATERELFMFVRRRSFVKQLPKKQRSKLARLAVKEKVFTNENALKVHLETVRSVVDSYGILSLTEKNDDILMFSHYADHHRGYCLQFRSDKDTVFGKAERIFYSGRYPKVQFFSGEQLEMTRAITLTKSDCWAYEKEWRTFKKIPGLFRYDEALLTGIILGCEMSSEDKERIKVFNAKRKTPAQLFQAVRKREEFGLDIVPV